MSDSSSHINTLFKTIEDTSNVHSYHRTSNFSNVGYTDSEMATVLPAVAFSALPGSLSPTTTAMDQWDGSFMNKSFNFEGAPMILDGSDYPSDDNVTGEINSFYFYQAEQFTVLWILFFMIVLGNSAVLVTLSLNKSRKSRMNFFIRQLAIADLTVGLISVLTDIVWRITVTWHAGNAACKLIRFAQGVVTYASTYVLVALSIDRYDAITHPMNFSGSWKRARILVVTAWLLSILFSLPMVFLFEEKVVQDRWQCWIDLQKWQWRVYMTLVTLALFVLPALIICACYTVIVRTIWSKSQMLLVPAHAHHNYRVNNNDHRALRNSEELHDCRRASSRGIIPKAKIKTVKMTFVIVFVFVICWSPYILFDLLQVYDYIPNTQANIAVASFIQSLAPLNSAANPVIYCLFSTHMCRTLRKLPPFKWATCCLGMCIPGLHTNSRGGGVSNSSHGAAAGADVANSVRGNGTTAAGRRHFFGRSRSNTESSTRTTTLSSSTSRRSAGGTTGMTSVRQQVVRIQAPASVAAAAILTSQRHQSFNNHEITHKMFPAHKVAISVV